MKKLPLELRRNLAREHGNGSSIEREINILEAGLTDEIIES